jgi:hypothetical protein
MDALEILVADRRHQRQRPLARVVQTRDRFRLGEPRVGSDRATYVP